MFENYDWLWLAEDEIVSREPCHFGGVVLNTSSDGGDVSVYDGTFANTPRLVGTFQALANQANPILFPKPLRLRNGLFIDVGSNVTGVLVAYRVA